MKTNLTSFHSPTSGPYYSIMDGPTLLNDIQKDDNILNKQN